MKKYILLLASLVGTAQAKELNSNTSSWNKYYTTQLSSSDKNALATGLYNLMKEKGNEQTTPLTVKLFHEITHGTCHYKCLNAFQKVFNKVVVASHDQADRETVWVESVRPYYADIVKQLPEEQRTISFGADRGKKLPTTEIELDRMLNPRPKIATVFQIHSSGFSVHVQM